MMSQKAQKRSNNIQSSPADGDSPALTCWSEDLHLRYQEHAFVLETTLVNDQSICHFISVSDVPQAAKKARINNIAPPAFGP